MSIASIPGRCRTLLRPVRLYLCLSVLLLVGSLGHFGGLDNSLQWHNRVLGRQPIRRQSPLYAGRSSLLSHLEASFPLLNVLLRVEEDDIDLGHVEHPEGHEGAKGHGDSQRGGLDKHLRRQLEENFTSLFFSWGCCAVASRQKKHEKGEGTSQHAAQTLLALVRASGMLTRHEICLPLFGF